MQHDFIFGQEGGEGGGGGWQGTAHDKHKTDRDGVSGEQSMQG
jgi:hypothetical protein